MTHTVYFLAATLLLITGLYLSRIQFLGHEWFSRSGSLVVMLGIWSALGGIVQEKLLSTRIRQKKRNAIVSARAELLEKNAGEHSVEKELSRINDIFDEQLHHAAENLRLSFGLQEVILLLSGTFIWGFGDLFCC